MEQDPDKGVSLSATRRQSARSRWAKVQGSATPPRIIAPVVAPVAPVAPVEAPAPATPKKRKPVPAAVTEHTMPARACIPYAKIVEAYHAGMPDAPRVRVMSDTTKGYVRARWNEDKDRQSVEWWQQFFRYCNTCPFLLGRTESRDGRPPFVADFQWLVKPTNFEKVVNGKYQ